MFEKKFMRPPRNLTPTTRGKPIITCLKFIKKYPMKRMCDVDKQIMRSLGNLNPAVTKLV